MSKQKSEVKGQEVVIERCSCTHDRTTIQIGYWEGCPLEGGGHTDFAVLRCQSCGKFCGFPDSNLQLALDRGTEKTKARLREILSSSNAQPSTDNG